MLVALDSQFSLHVRSFSLVFHSSSFVEDSTLGSPRVAWGSLAMIPSH